MFIQDLKTEYSKKENLRTFGTWAIIPAYCDLGQSRRLLKQHAEVSWHCHLYLPKPLYIAAKSGLSVSLWFHLGINTGRSKGTTLRTDYELTEGLLE